MAKSNVTAVTNHFPSVNEGYATTVGAAGVTSGGTEVPLTDVTALTDASIFVGVVEPSAVNQQVFTGTVDKANSKIIGVKWTRGSNAAHPAGSVVVDYMTGTVVNMVSKGLSVSLNQDGTLKDGIVTGPKIDPTALAALTPVGVVSDFAGTVAPSGWLFCYGQAISRVTYASLFTAVGTTYGVGDGSSTFNVPDARGRVIAGQDDMGGTSANRLTGVSGGVDGDVMGAVGGAESHILLEAQMPSHTHSGNTAGEGNHSHTMGREYGTNVNLVAPGQFGQISTTGSKSFSTETSGWHGHSFTTNATGSGTAHNNVQPTLVLNKIIKY